MDFVALLIGVFAGSVVTALGSHWLRKNKPADYDMIAARVKELEAKLEAAVK
jgi:uncharacterized membrane-anchored protein YhcB (DUF1043 family)